MNFRLLSLLLSAGALLTTPAVSSQAPAELGQNESAVAKSLRVSNNHPFPIRETILFHLPADLAETARNLLAVSHSVAGGTVEAHYLPIQLLPAAEGEAVPAWIDVQLRPSESRLYTFQDIGGSPPAPPQEATIESFSSVLPRSVTWPSGVVTELFDLALLERAAPGEAHPGPGDWIEEQLAVLEKMEFTPVEARQGPVTTTLLFRSKAATANGPALELRYDLYSSGTADVTITLHRQPGTEAVEVFLVKEVPSPAGEAVAIGAGGEVIPLPEGARSPERQAPFGRDADWLALENTSEGSTRALLAAHAAAGGRLVNQLVVTGHGNHWMLAGLRAEQDAFPAATDTVHLHYRVLPSRTRTLEEVDRAFRAFAGYRAHQAEEDAFHVSFGVQAVRFGASYAPHLLPADQEGVSVAERWPALREEIRRNFRIANALGLDWLRIHGVDAPDSSDDHLTETGGAWILDYLSFLAQTASESGLKLHLAASLSPGDARRAAESLGETLGAFEVRIPPTPAAEWIEYFGEVRDQVKSVRPEAVVVMAGPVQDLPLLQALGKGGAPAEALGMYLRLESPEATPIAADAALALGSYAGQHRLLPVAAEFAIGSGRQSELAEAQHFFRAFESVLDRRSLAAVTQLPLATSGTAGPGPTSLLHLDGTPRMQGHAYHELIKRYGGTDATGHAVEVTMPVTSIRPGETRAVPVTITNRSSRPLETRSNLHLPAGLTVQEEEAVMTLRPRQSRTMRRTITAAPDLAPGFHHFFEEVRYEDRVRFGWSHASYRGAPQLDLTTEPAAGVRYAGGLASLEAVNLSNLRHLVFGRDASATELAWAGKLHETLRVATGANLQKWPDNQIGANARTRSLAVIGTEESNPFLAEIREALPMDPASLAPGEGVVMVVPHPTERHRFLLVVSGRDAEGIEKAAADLLARYRP